MARTRSLFLCASTLMALVGLVAPLRAQGTTSTPGKDAATISGKIETVTVTAQKFSQNVNDVGMSIQVLSGNKLARLGITDTSDLVKVVPGFNYTPSYYGAPVYSIRGVGFLDTSFTASPTVSVYVDQMPLPFSIMTTGASLDVQRVEVLKGPQGTLFGENATGGAINYVTNKPTDTWQAGVDATYGRFNTVDLDGYVSGPLSDTLDFRLAARHIGSGDWQYSYTHPAYSGARRIWEGRASFLWKPQQNFKALLQLSGFTDNSDTQMPQLFGIAVLSPVSGLDPRLGVFPFNQFGSVGQGYHYPFAPHNDRAADWSACVNTSPLDPPFNTTPIGSVKPTTSTSCAPARNHNDMFSAALRLDYKLPSDITVTSLTLFEHFDRHSTIEGDGTIYQDYESLQSGYITTTYQELRVSGDFNGKGHWMVGGNYEADSTYDHFLQTYGGSTASPTALPGSVLCGAINCTGVNLTGVPLYYFTYLGPTQPVDQQQTSIYAGYANMQYPITRTLTFQAGARYTQTNKSFHGCGNDGGDGTWATVSQQIQDLLELLHGTITPAQYLQPGTSPGGNGINVGPGQCATTGPGPTFNPQYFTDTLDQNNVSWRTGFNWKAWRGTLLYFNVSQGWKEGAYPTVATSSYTQLAPARQEGLLAYEVGFKSTLAHDTLQLNGAAFYYDYKDKQLLGAIVDPVFGPLPKLINVPRSHIDGFELSADWMPIPGLSLSPAITFVESRIDGCSAGPNCVGGQFYNFDPFNQYSNLTGEAFPSTPKWAGNMGASYEWPLKGELMGFVGTNINYQSATSGFFYDRTSALLPYNVLNIPARTLVDLRAGVENGRWTFQIWAHNVFDQYYWTGAAHVNDVLVHYTGMPRTYGITFSYKFF